MTQNLNFFIQYTNFFFNSFLSSATGPHSNTSLPSTKSATTARMTSPGAAFPLAESPGSNDKRPLLSRSESELNMSN